MSLDKAIEHGHEHRAPYRHAKAVDATCRNHGSCTLCRGDRLHQSIREVERVADALDEWEGSDDS